MWEWYKKNFFSLSGKDFESSGKDFESSGKDFESSGKDFESSAKTEKAEKFFFENLLRKFISYKNY
jgi:hypothetical protein